MALRHGGDIWGVAARYGWDWHEVLDASASINPLGPAPGVRAAICNAVERIVHYPEPHASTLCGALAQLWDVTPEQLIVGNGATELLFFVARLFRGKPVTLALPVFSEFQRAFPDARKAALMDPDSWGRDSLVVLTRPANPTGATIPLDSFRRDQWMLIDESFLEFSGLPSASTLIREFPRLLVLRSLTKFYALPGLRVGALVASSSVAAEWRRVREPWQVNVLAQSAAIAAIKDTDHAARSVEYVRRERAWMFDQISQLPGVTPTPGDANFVYVRLGYRADALCRFLLNQKILIRNCSEWPGLEAEGVRVAVRCREENERLLQAWRQFTCD